jgi:hypothetical protein
MDRAEQEHLKGRLERLGRLLLQTTDPAVAAVLNDTIADIESRLRAAQSPTGQAEKDSK